MFCKSQHMAFTVVLEPDAGPCAEVCLALESLPTLRARCELFDAAIKFKEALGHDVASTTFTLPTGSCSPSLAAVVLQWLCPAQPISKHVDMPHDSEQQPRGNLGQAFGGGCEEATPQVADEVVADCNGQEEPQLPSVEGMDSVGWTDTNAIVEQKVQTIDRHVASNACDGSTPPHGHSLNLPLLLDAALEMHLPPAAPPTGQAPAPDADANAASSPPASPLAALPSGDSPAPDVHSVQTAPDVRSVPTATPSSPSSGEIPAPTYAVSVPTASDTLETTSAPSSHTTYEISPTDQAHIDSVICDEDQCSAALKTDESFPSSHTQSPAHSHTTPTPTPTPTSHNRHLSTHKNTHVGGQSTTTTRPATASQPINNIRPAATASQPTTTTRPATASQPTNNTRPATASQATTNIRPAATASQQASKSSSAFANNPSCAHALQRPPSRAPKHNVTPGTLNNVRPTSRGLHSPIPYTTHNINTTNTTATRSISMSTRLSHYIPASPGTGPGNQPRLANSPTTAGQSTSHNATTRRPANRSTNTTAPSPATALAPTTASTRTSAARPSTPLIANTSVCASRTSPGHLQTIPIPTTPVRTPTTSTRTTSTRPSHTPPIRPSPIQTSASSSTTPPPPTSTRTPTPTHSTPTISARSKPITSLDTPPPRPTPGPTPPSRSIPAHPEFITPATVASLLELSNHWQCGALKAALMRALRHGGDFCMGFKKTPDILSQQIPQVMRLLDACLEWVGDADGALHRLSSDCDAWMAVNANRAWATRHFSELPRAVQERVYHRAVERLAVHGAFKALLKCRQLKASLPSGISWASKVQVWADQLHQKTLDFIWTNICSVLMSPHLRSDLASPWSAEAVSEVALYAQEHPEPVHILELLAAWPRVSQYFPQDQEEELPHVHESVMALHRQVAQYAARQVVFLCRTPAWRSLTDAERGVVATQLRAAQIDPTRAALMEQVFDEHKVGVKAATGKGDVTAGRKMVEGMQPTQIVGGVVGRAAGQTVGQASGAMVRSVARPAGTTPGAQSGLLAAAQAPQGLPGRVVRPVPYQAAGSVRTAPLPLHVSGVVLGSDADKARAEMQGAAAGSSSTAASASSTDAAAGPSTSSSTAAAGPSTSSPPHQSTPHMTSTSSATSGGQGRTPASASTGRRGPGGSAAGMLSRRDGAVTTHQARLGQHQGRQGSTARPAAAADTSATPGAAADTSARPAVAARVSSATPHVPQ